VAPHFSDDREEQKFSSYICVNMAVGMDNNQNVDIYP